MWLASQIVAGIALVIISYGFLRREKTKTLFWLGIGFLVYVISAGLLLNWVGVAVVSIMAMQNFVYAYFEKRNIPYNTKLSFFTMLFFIAINIIAIYFTIEWWFDWVIMTASIILVIATWAKGIHAIRFAEVLFTSAMTVNHVIFFNIVAILIEQIILISIIVFYFRFFATRKHKDLQE
ncbi:MAG: YgjV family protein [Firmicutes bacterium]|nr:YgjV family protein [Bacillota bacterium]